MTDSGAHGWPRWMSREIAAEYVGVSTTTFDQEVVAKMWPAAQKRGKKGGRLTWDRSLLDQQSDRLSGLNIGVPANGNLASAWRERNNRKRPTAA